MLSKSCQYAIRTLLFLCTRSKDNHRVRLQEISEALHSPAPFTSKILQQLVTAGLVQSKKGASGGFEIGEGGCEKITLNQIIEVIDGHSLAIGCFIGLSECNDINPCPVHHLYFPIKSSLNANLMNINLHQILSDPKLININLKS